MKKEVIYNGDEKPSMVPNFQTVTFHREKLRHSMKLSRDYIHDMKVAKGMDQDDFIMNTVTYHFEAYLFSRATDERELVYYTEKPKFLDWLFGRTRKIVFRLKIKELLSTQKETIQIYEINRE